MMCGGDFIINKNRPVYNKFDHKTDVHYINKQLVYQQYGQDGYEKLSKPFEVSVIVAAAPDLREKNAKQRRPY